MKTIKDVAKAAGVSVATVSRVLNGSASVSEKTRLHVLQVVQETGYVPNVLGRNLRTSATHMILVILPTFSNQFYSRILRGIEDAARENGYQAMFCPTHNDLPVEEGYMKLLENQSADGAIFLSSRQDAARLTALSRRRPAVFGCEPVPGAALSCVSIDNYQAGYETVNSLLRRGHERIAILYHAETYSAILRRQGYQKALLEAGIPLRREYMMETDYRWQSGVAACERLLRLPEPPTAVFCVSDLLAAGVMRALSQNGLRAGRDMAVVGFDDTTVASLLTPALSSVSQPRREIGRTAVELLLRKMKDLTGSAEYVYLPYTLIHRESSDDQIK